MSRLLGLTGSLVLCWTGLMAVLPGALPTAAAEPAGLLDETQAMALARQTGKPVVVSAKTNETTLITADPTTGLFTAELSPRPARVRDGAGGWRDPSARLVQAADGAWHTEAGIADVTVSDGGAGVVASLAQGSVSAAVSWPDELPTPLVDADTATYSEVLPGVDLVVRADIDAVESYLVVKTPEAAQNPEVRSWSMPISTTGLTVRSDAGGVKSLVDSDGVAQMTVPKAMMWDSSGKGAAISDTDDLLAEVPQTQTAKVSVKMTSTSLTASADSSFLDDPSTVYPVVIDPVLQLAPELNHVLRVTDDWSKWDSEVGSQGKIGYNGWTSPYYRSRMFYQIKWPLNPDGSGLIPGQISQGIFQYTQTHSPQHSPCLSSSTSYPSERAKLATTIESSDTWSDRTEAGGGWHPQASVPPVTRMAVGHEDYCSKSYVEQWDLTGVLKTERTNYSTRTTVTVGIYSDDETDKMGWKYYTNNYGSSPKLLLSYEIVPQPPQSLAVSDTNAQGLVTSRTPTVSARLSLAKGDACVSSACLYGTFTIAGSDGSRRTATAGPVANGGLAQMAIPSSQALRDSTTYTVTVSAYSGDVAVSPPMYSEPSTLSFRTSAGAPAKPVSVTVSDPTTGGLVWSRTPKLSALLSLAAGDSCVHSPCLMAAFTLTGPDGVATNLPPVGPVPSSTTVQVVSPALLDNTQYTVSVRAYSTEVPFSSWSDVLTFRTSPALGQVSSLALRDQTGAVATGLPPVVATEWPGLAVTLPNDDVCPGSTPACLVATLQILSADGTQKYTWSSDPSRRGVQVSPPSDKGPVLDEAGNYTFRAWVTNTATSKSSSPVQLDFQRSSGLFAPILGDSLSVTPEGVAVLVTNPVKTGTYTARIIVTPDGGDASQQEVEGTLDAQGNLLIPVPLSGDGDVAVTAVSYVSDGSSSAEWQGDLHVSYGN